MLGGRHRELIQHYVDEMADRDHVLDVQRLQDQRARARQQGRDHLEAGVLGRRPDQQDVAALADDLTPQQFVERLQPGDRIESRGYDDPAAERRYLPSGLKATLKT